MLDKRKKRALEEKDLYRDRVSKTNKQLAVSLPIPPSVNHMYVRTRSGGNKLSKRSERYIRDSRALINLAIEEQYWNMPSYATWLYVDLVFFMPDRRIRDSHNCLKLLMDVLQGVVFENDYFVMPRIQAVEYDVKNPRVNVFVSKQTKASREKGIRMATVQ